MDLSHDVRSIIKTLGANHFYATCPCCGEPILLKDAGLFYRDNFPPQAAEAHLRQWEQLKEHEREIRERRKQIAETSAVGAQAVNIGFVLERIAPSLQSFQFEKNDCRSLFDPIDYIIFEGLSKNGVVDRIIFSDIKTGGSRLSSKQKDIRDVVERKNVEWDTYDAGANQ